MTRVFVYGTLLRGEPNHPVLGGCLLVAQARTRSEFTFHSLGGFPGMIRGSDIDHQVVIGEIYEVDRAALDRLDRLEGHPSFYERTEIVLECGSVVQTYLLARDRFGNEPRILSGSWREHRKASHENYYARRA
jgi:gamma-glutamylaminecyclotransferase